MSTDLESQLSVSCKCYEAANEILQFSDLKSQNPEHYVQVLKRMGNIRNEIGVFYMNQAAALQSERVGEYPCGVLPLLPFPSENHMDFGSSKELWHLILSPGCSVKKNIFFLNFQEMKLGKNMIFPLEFIS